MKQLTIFVICLFLGTLCHAQPWLKDHTPGTPVKLQDVIDEWKATHTAEAEKESENEEDDVNYQFDRWVAFWRYHTDENGYLVSQVRTMREWEAYKATHNINQSHARTTATAMWNFAGPDGSTANGKGMGRIETVTFHPTDSNTFWVGSAGGGAWKTTDGGMHWNCITDNAYPVRGVSDITVNPLNTNSIFLCTGDKDAQDNYSIGILHSTNGGASWDTVAGLTWAPTQGVLANSMLINPSDTNTLLLATNIGLYRSLNAGVSWSIVKTGAFKQLVYSKVDTSIVFATGGPSANVYRSADGGATWTQITNIISCVRMALAVTPQNPAIVKAISSNTLWDRRLLHFI
ncbi:MAG: hypothetical protein H0X33_12540 [Taibaiella sp.]|nr:hypothetical protein [Taibaiella sp.]